MAATKLPMANLIMMALPHYDDWEAIPIMGAAQAPT
jgi:hypothetical protein